MGSWFDSDNLYRQYGPTKAVAVTAGDYLQYGPYRQLEVDIDLTTLTTSPVIQDNVTFFPQGVFIESVEVESTTSATGGTSLSVGLVNLDRSTVESNTKFLAAAPIADHTTAGQQKLYTVGVTGVGAGVGGTATNAGYITALAAGTYSAGKVKVRIRYRGTPPITQ
jgi:hypothetical protein